jgi:hypothetical protein
MEYLLNLELNTSFHSVNGAILMTVVQLQCAFGCSFSFVPTTETGARRVTIDLHFTLPLLAPSTEILPVRPPDDRIPKQTI